MSINEVLSLNAKTGVCLLVGSPEAWRETLSDRLRVWLAVENLNQASDLWWRRYESFGIKDSHELIEKEARRALSGSGRFFVLEVFSMTSEAQNALLKTFEEPASDTRFFLIAPSADIFLPTLRSRLTILEASWLGTSPSEKVGGVGRSDYISAADFFKLDVADRVTFVREKLLQPKGKVFKSDLVAFIVELERYLRQRYQSSIVITDEVAEALQELEQARRYLTDPRSGNRLILEHLALSLPVIS